MYIFDTREKKNEHIKAYFAKNGLEYREQALPVGDYMADGGKVSVDRKRNLEELSRNLMNRDDHARFWREVRRCSELGIKLIVLCEHGGRIKAIGDVASWRSKYSPVTGRDLMDAIYRTHISYGVEFIFCDKRSTGRRIKELLSDELCGGDKASDSGGGVVGALRL